MCRIKNYVLSNVLLCFKVLSETILAIVKLMRKCGSAPFSLTMM